MKLEIDVKCADCMFFDYSSDDIGLCKCWRSPLYEGDVSHNAYTCIKEDTEPCECFVLFDNRREYRDER